ncbi:Terminase-like family protein [Faunimonas pinastri]|uniref:Terminase-like family protein n=1 Tax=Faunimonas pinastri TaxID=1855383 RepID=A0A1H9MR89_9HYPH|nr:phage terminase large subunit [Faunimonas pinastri]SER26226.1 Terminase-like family protein [Faunimonas pinastri]
MTAHTLTLHKGQRTVFRDHRRFKVVVAGRRWGKTQLSKISICRKASKPKQLIWYVAPTYGMARSILWDELREAIPRAWIQSVNETRMSIRLHNGTRIELKGADKPDTLRGVGLNHLIIDEAQDIREDTWYKVLRPTLASTRGDVLIIGTPKSFNWLYDLYMLGQRGDHYVTKKGQRRLNPWKSWQFPTITSPFIPKEEIEAARGDMDEKSFRQEFEASFETMSGRVYHAFDRKIHVGDYAFNPKLPIWVGQDFNIDPMSSVIMQQQENGEVWIVDEAILFGSNTQETANEISRRYYRHMGQTTFYPDPAGANRGHSRGESDLDILREAGFKRLKYRRKHPKVADRINAVNRMFQSGDGQIRLRVDSKCKHAIAAFEQTIYKPGTREVDKSAGYEHPADAVGYCIDLEFPVREVTILGLSL